MHVLLTGDGQTNPLRLLEEMVWPHVAVSHRDDRWSTLVSNEHGNLCVGKAALARLRDKI
jgi:predicted solute-binding protein